MRLRYLELPGNIDDRVPYLLIADEVGDGRPIEEIKRLGEDLREAMGIDNACAGALVFSARVELPQAED